MRRISRNPSHPSFVICLLHRPGAAQAGSVLFPTNLDAHRRRFRTAPSLSCSMYVLRGWLRTREVRAFCPATDRPRVCGSQLRPVRFENDASQDGPRPHGMSRLLDDTFSMPSGHGDRSPLELTSSRRFARRGPAPVLGIAQVPSATCEAPDFRGGARVRHGGSGLRSAPGFSGGLAASLRSKRFIEAARSSKKETHG